MPDISWFVIIDGEQQGPFSSRAVLDLIKTGHINSETLVWREGMNDWQAFESVNELSDSLQVNGENELSVESNMNYLPVTREMLRRLRGKNLLTKDAFAEALCALETPRQWGLWAYRLMLAIGLALCLAAIVFFFAANWRAIPGWGKFSMVEMGLLISVLAAWKLKLDTLGGQLTTFVASVLVGVFLAVFGQVYQTGADSYSLYAMWGVLILPWAIACRFAPLWGMWIIVANFAVFLYWRQGVGGMHMTFEPSALFVIGMLNIAFLAVKEIIERRGAQWAAARWMRYLLAIFILLSLSYPTSVFLAKTSSVPDDLFFPICAISYGCVLCAAYAVYRYSIPDIGMLGLSALSVGVLIMVWMIRAMFDGIIRSPIAGFLFMGIISLAVFAGLAILLMFLLKGMDTGSGLAERLRALYGGKSLPLEELIQRLEEKDLVGEEDGQRIRAQAITLKTAGPVPTSIRVLLIVGAWFSTLFFIGFISALGVFSGSWVGAFIVGLIVGGAAIGIHSQIQEHAQTTGAIFWSHVSLICMLVGKILIMISVSIMMSMRLFTGNALLLSLAAGALSTLTYSIFKNNLERFLSASATLLLFQAYLFSMQYRFGFALFDVLTLVGLGLAFLGNGNRERFTPLGYACAVSLCLSLGYHSLYQSKMCGYGMQCWAYWDKLPENLALAMGAIVVLRGLAGSGEVLIKAPASWAVICILALGLLGVPGVVAALCMLTLGHASHDRPLTGFGFAALSIFLFLFYYQLDISLLIKSGALLVGGLLMLAGAYLLDRKEWAV